MGTFHVGVVCSQKIVVLQGQWKERDVPPLVSGQEVPLQTGTCGFSGLDQVWRYPCLDKRESDNFTTGAVFRKYILRGPKCYSRPSYRHADARRCSPQGSCRSVAGGGIQKQVTTTAAPGIREVAARKKKVSMNYFCPPQKICPRIFSAYTE